MNLSKDHKDIVHSHDNFTEPPLPYYPCNLDVTLLKPYQGLKESSITYTKHASERSPQISIRLKTLPISLAELDENNETTEFGIDHKLRIIDGFQFSDNPEYFHTAVENKQSGFGVNTEQMIYHNLTGEIDHIDPNVFIDSLPVSIYAL